MLMPKRVKYRRVQRGRMKGKASRGNVVNYGEFGLQAQEPCWLTSNRKVAAFIALPSSALRGGLRGGPHRKDTVSSIGFLCPCSSAGAAVLAGNPNGSRQQGSTPSGREKASLTFCASK